MYALYIDKKLHTRTEDCDNRSGSGDGAQSLRTSYPEFAVSGWECKNNSLISKYEWLLTMIYKAIVRNADGCFGYSCRSISSFWVAVIRRAARTNSKMSACFASPSPASCTQESNNCNRKSCCSHQRRNVFGIAGTFATRVTKDFRKQWEIKNIGSMRWCAQVYNKKTRLFKSIARWLTGVWLVDTILSDSVLICLRWCPPS